MKLRVKADAKKGHWVRDVLVQPGEELPGNFARVPPGMEYKLEEVKGSGAKAAAASSAPGTDDNWYKNLAKDLGKDPTKSDLQEYAMEEFSEDVDPDTLDKAEMIAEITKLVNERA